LKGIGYLLPQAWAQIARGLEESLSVLDVYAERRDPAESVTEAVLILNQALRLATEVGGLLEGAHQADRADQPEAVLRSLDEGDWR